MKGSVTSGAKSLRKSSKSLLPTVPLPSKSEGHEGLLLLPQDSFRKPHRKTYPDHTRNSCRKSRCPLWRSGHNCWQSCWCIQAQPNLHIHKTAHLVRNLATSLCVVIQGQQIHASRIDAILISPEIVDVSPKAEIACVVVLTRLVAFTIVKEPSRHFHRDDSCMQWGQSKRRKIRSRKVLLGNSVCVGVVIAYQGLGNQLLPAPGSARSSKNLTTFYKCEQFSVPLVPSRSQNPTRNCWLTRCHTDTSTASNPPYQGQRHH